MDSNSSPQGPSSGRWIRLLAREDLAGLVGASLSAALLARPGWSRVEVLRLRREVLARLGRELAARARRVRALTRAECRAELEREHAELLQRRVRQEGLLDALEREVHTLRARGPGDDEHDEQALLRTLESDLEVLLAARDRRTAMAAVLKRESERRARARAAAVGRERERIDLLERRLRKLREAHARTEEALAELARRAALDTGVPSIYRNVQGLAADAPERELKTHLLGRIYQENVRLQRRSA